MNEVRAILPAGVAAPRAAPMIMLLLAAAAPLVLPWAPALAAAVLLGCGGLAMLQGAVTGRRPETPDVLIDAVAIGALALARNDALRVWQVPDTWADALRTTAAGSALAILVYGLAAAAAITRARRHLALREAVGVGLLPVMFSLLLMLASGVLMNRLGFWLTGQAAIDDAVRGAIGRMAVLIVFVEALTVALRGLVAGRLRRDLRLHALLVGSAVHAAAAPLIADATQVAEAAGPLARIVAGILTAALAQAGLWALVFIATGLIIDGLSNVPPTFAGARRHWTHGLVKGGIYGAVFVGLLLVAGEALRVAALRAFLAGLPCLAGLAGGALLFPLAATIVASADGTPPFFGRLRRAYRDPRAYGRGAVSGLGVALFLGLGLPGAAGSLRFLAGLAVGALAYGGVDLLADVLERRAGRRAVLEGWRLYVLGLTLGGAVGGALGWYFDAAQIAVVAAKFWSYAALGSPLGGAFVVYPLFNKWGAIDLGHAGGGVRLFFDESLSGVINWAIAAPLFSINYFVLAALLDRSLSPLKALISPKGFEGLVEQAVRVLRWGLWMAPVINTFLRQSPDPSWYNQDGLVRTAAASLASGILPAGDFRAWSLAGFTALLAYDWLRIVIWFDHMGLRVATLVNLTFLGGDRLDERAARFAGHAARTRIVPVGIRRFATWAPLLIPFYIPHGADWDTAWTGAEQIRAKLPPWSAAVDSLTIAYGLAGLGAIATAIAVRRNWDPRRPPAAVETATLPPGLDRAPARFGLSNGSAKIELLPDGRGNLSIDGIVRDGHDVDVDKRVTDPLQLRGCFFYLRDLDDGALWSLGYEPLRKVGADYAADQPTPLNARLRNTVAGVAAEGEVRLGAGAPIEFWTLRLANREDRPRRLTVTSYREIAVHEPGAYTRDADFNALHVGTWFVARLQGLFLRNRLLRRSGRMSPETFFHAVRLGAGCSLVGYEDSRTRFLGQSGPRDPLGLRPGRARRPDDEGLLHTFDPAVSLSVAVDLPARSSCELRFVTGCGRDERHAAEIVADHTETVRPSPDELAAVWMRGRIIEPLPRPDAGLWRFAFSEAGDALHLTSSTPRPWAHVLANPDGFGTVVSNEGEIHSFNANARQNALTPFRFESVPAGNPGQLVYVVDLESGEIETAGFVPFRRPDRRNEVCYGPGFATFTGSGRETDLTLTVFVPPDAPADVRILTVRNRGDRARRYRIVPYFDMALDESAEDGVGRLVAEQDDASETLLFTNPRNDFHKGWAVAATSLTGVTREVVRTRFLGGAGRDLTNPYMVDTGAPESSRPDDGRRVAAFAGTVAVGPNSAAEVVIVLGQARTRAEAVALGATLRDPATARSALAATRAWWAGRLGAVRIATNDAAFDRLVNHWLPYQVLAARLWGRNGPNQRGGAYGFRDQLQDVLPFVFSDPDLARRQIVLHAGAQFPEGDVFKWWHVAPDGGTGLGQRTRASDPHLWLPYVVTRYVEATGDRSVLEETAAYLEGPAIPEGAADLLIAPRPSREVGDVYDHCRRAIDYTLARFGAHGLPLVGTGDWNDGIDAAGAGGRGESLWLSFFLHDILRRFAPLAAARQGDEAGGRLREAADALKAAIATAWTGDHFVFDYTDDGDILDQSSIMTGAWPALSGAVDPERALVALDHALRDLGRPDRILLLAPPFDETSHPHPGRIADYPPGVRENGGQYSHGCSWTVDAFVALAEAAGSRGDRARAAELRARAFAAWRAISPLDKTEGEALATYGLVPIQQPADIYDGPAYGGRGGWSWYTGSAARMLSAAYAVVGLRMDNGRIVVPDDLFEPRGTLEVRELAVHDRIYRAPDSSHDDPVRTAAQ